MEKSNLPLSEQYRIVAKKWVDQDNAARLLEATRSAVLEEMKNALILENPKWSDAHATRVAKSDPRWREFNKSMVETRTEANLSKVQLEYIKMRSVEEQSYEATKRAEMKL